jgi:hypothetical protein
MSEPMLLSFMLRQKCQPATGKSLLIADLVRRRLGPPPHLPNRGLGGHCSARPTDETNHGAWTCWKTQSTHSWAHAWAQSSPPRRRYDPTGRVWLWPLFLTDMPIGLRLLKRPCTNFRSCSDNTMGHLRRADD